MAPALQLPNFPLFRSVLSYSLYSHNQEGFYSNLQAFYEGTLPCAPTHPRFYPPNHQPPRVQQFPLLYILSCILHILYSLLIHHRTSLQPRLLLENAGRYHLAKVEGIFWSRGLSLEYGPLRLYLREICLRW